MATQQDNTTLDLKVALRLNLLRHIADPVILETHGGYGHVWLRCYFNFAQGVVIEKNPDKAETLARQRPTWSVVEGDCVKAVAAGMGDHLPINLVDVDPYGEPWPVLSALFESTRPWPPTLGIVVNDGLKQKIQLGAAWDINSMHRMVEKYGNAYISEHYLEIAREMLADLAAPQGYTITQWTAYHCGRNLMMSHYAAVLQRPS